MATAEAAVRISPLARVNMRAVRTYDASVLIVGESSAVEFARGALDGVARLSHCETAAAALDVLGRAPVDIVVADEHLSDASAPALLDRLRRELPGTDFVAICEAVPRELSGGHGVRAVDILTRPVDPYVLRRTVDQILLRRRLLEENRRLLDTLHTVEACGALAQCLEPGGVYPAALDLLLGSLSRSRGLAIFRRLTVPLGNTAAFRGFSDAEAGRLRQLLIEDKPLDIGGFSEAAVIERGPVHAAVSELGLETASMLSVPVLGENGEGGVIWIFEDGRPFEADEQERARLIGRHAEAALQNAERYHLAKERAFIDDVTEVYNARYLLSATENELRRADRYGSTLSVLFLDLDRFKLVNDRYGHLIGSHTLRSLSQVLLQCVREVDTLARYGGDEFTILLVDTDHEEALRIAQRIRQTVAEHVFEAAGDGSLRLTISIGVATCPGHGMERDLLLDNADKAMYRAKSLGRNRVCSVDELDD
jgi:diguanylate cyclase (GGDEF)-like protein